MSDYLPIAPNQPWKFVIVESDSSVSSSSGSEMECEPTSPGLSPPTPTSSEPKAQDFFDNEAQEDLRSNLSSTSSVRGAAYELEMEINNASDDSSVMIVDEIIHGDPLAQQVAEFFEDEENEASSAESTHDIGLEYWQIEENWNMRNTSDSDAHEVIAPWNPTPVLDSEGYQPLSAGYNPIPSPLYSDNGTDEVEIIFDKAEEEKKKLLASLLQLNGHPVVRIPRLDQAKFHNMAVDAINRYAPEKDK